MTESYRLAFAPAGKIAAGLLIFLAANLTISAQDRAPYLDDSQPLEARAKDLVSRLTLEEKAHQMMHRAPAIPRLNIPAYNWWNEGLHGVARSGVATVFPQAIALGATFDEDLVHRVATAISDEARANYNASVAKGYHLQYSGLTFWTPNINIFRDPRWGRGQETYGEDPFLTGRLGSAFVRGLQGDDPRYLKVAACAKHFAVHSGPERLRHQFNAKATAKDLNETYLPAFKALVDANVETVMCAYNRTNDEPCCANNFLLTETLRKAWGFKGHVVSDCWAIVDFYHKDGHKTVPTQAEAVALSVKSGVSLNCGDEYPALVEAVQKGLITEQEIDAALQTLLMTRFRLGLFDPKEKNPYNNISAEVINSEKHRALAREAAAKSIVLLKNNGVLPLKNDLAKYFVTGPNAESVYALMGNYYGVNPDMVTYLEGLAAAIAPGSQLQYKPGVMIDRDNINPIDWTTGDAKACDVTFVVMGITGALEGEEGESIASPHFGDRLDYDLPANQIAFLKKIREGNSKPVVAVITGGSPMNLAEVHDIADAVLLTWYGGEEAGNALADIVFGKISPSGKLPVTFPKSLDQIPAYDDYSMKGRTYRYMESEPMYPFGFGLTFGKLSYSDIRISAPAVRRNQPLEAEVTLTNKGGMDTDEVVQLYLTDLDAKYATPLYSLKAFQRVDVPANSSTVVKFTVTPEMMQTVNDKGEVLTDPGKFKITIGSSSPGTRAVTLGQTEATSAVFTLK